MSKQTTLVKAETLHTCPKCSQPGFTAAGAAKSLPILMAKDVLEKPFNALPEARKQEVEKILHKAVDGQTMHEMMIRFGVWKDKAHKSPPKPTKKSAENRNENANNETLTAEQLMQQAKDDRDALHDMHIGGAWKNLDDADLADLENKLTAYTAAVAAEHKKRKGTK
ncbi:hypothetical protein [Prosthecobacter sp.]|uniref:hypothetical protein n=1 Tax=Prosthecobacter sp. TaxID=1965333 RepID=UPI003782FCF6